MKLIFLDIDGVLNHEMWYSSDQYQNEFGLLKNMDDEVYHQSNIDPRCLDMLQELCIDTDAKVVISSSWRSGRKPEWFENLFSSLGFDQIEVIGCTPHLYFTGLEGYDYSVPRGNEIKAWMEINKDILGAKMTRVKYVIFDDDSDMLYWQRNNFFWVDRWNGLTPNIIYKAKNLLLT